VDANVLTYALYATTGQSQSMLSRCLNIHFLGVIEESHSWDVDACFQSIYYTT
jgi:hypothetical protein